MGVQTFVGTSKHSTLQVESARERRMEPARELGKGLLILGLVIAAVGVFLLAGPRLPFRLGRLPGDISYHGRHTTFYFPIVTCILLSVVLTVILWIVGAMLR